MMVGVVDKKNNKKGKNNVDRKKHSKKVDVKVYEKYTCYAVGLIILLLLFAVIKNFIFVPAFLITVALELFCIAYYYFDNKERQSLVYILFGFGVVLVLIAIIYTIFKIV